MFHELAENGCFIDLKHRVFGVNEDTVRGEHISWLYFIDVACLDFCGFSANPLGEMAVVMINFIVLSVFLPVSPLPK